MLARVDSALTFNRNDMAARAYELLCKDLTFKNPQYSATEMLIKGMENNLKKRAAFITSREENAVKAKISRLRWSLNSTPETLSFVEEFAGGDVRIARGAVKLLKKHDPSVLFEDHRVKFGPTIHAGGELQLRSYQRESLEKFVKARQGYVVLPCGAGKSSTAFGIIRELREPTFVLVASLDLAAQWKDELKAKIDVDATIVGGGENKVSPVTIGVAQTLVRWEQDKLDELLGQFGMLVVDECHHIAAPLLSKIVDRCPAYYRLGLTATPEREDGLTELLDLYLGEKLLEVKHAELVALGVLIVPSVTTVDTGFVYEYRSQDDYQPMLEALAYSPERNALIVEHIKREAEAGATCLVLSGRRDHLSILRTRLEEAGVNCELMTASVSKRKRKEIIERAKRGEVAVLLATSLADEGLDIPRLSRAFFVFPGKSQGRTVQRVGRIMRPHADKQDAVIYDFADKAIPPLKRHYLERRRIYSTMLGIPASKCTTVGRYQ